jgi:hypothetical protein
MNLLNIKNILNKQGFLYIKSPAVKRNSLERYLLEISNQLGEITPTRGRTLIDVLIPTEIKEAKINSLSKIYGKGQQPWHMDTAHWIEPARYVVLACKVVGNNSCPTEIAKWSDIKLSKNEFELFETEPFLIRNGSKSFLSTITNSTRKFNRYDPGCMEPISSDAEEALNIISQKAEKVKVSIDWNVNDILIVDNWSCLHRRSDAQNSENRIILRSTIKG